MRSSCKRWLAGVLSGVLLAACHAQPVAMSDPPMASSASAGLKVRIRLPGEVIRHVASIAEEVERLKLIVTTVNGQVWERELYRPAFDGYRAEATFSGLPAGGVQLKAIAYDQQERRVGSGVVESSVAPGVEKTVELVLSLDMEDRFAEIVTATGSVPPLPASTIAAQNSAVHGDLIVAEDGTIWVSASGTLQELGQDASVVSAVGGLNAYHSLFAVDANGHVWDGSDPLTEYAPDGTLVKSYPGLQGVPIWAKDGNMWLLGGGSPFYAYFLTARKVARDGTLLHTTEFRTQGMVGGQVAPGSGHLWVTLNAGDTIVRQLAEDGRVLSGSRPLQSVFDIEVTNSGLYFEGFDAGIAPDATGHAWLVNFWSSKVSKIGPDGTIVGEYAVCPHPNAVAVDGQGNVWVGSYAKLENNLVKLAPDGTLLGALTLDGGIRRLKTDGQGDVWVATSGPASAVYRLAR